MNPEIRAFFDEPTNTVSYLVWNPDERRGVVIDPVLDFDPASGTVDDGSVEDLLKAAEDEGIAIEWVLETHVHADHLSGAPLIKARTGAKVAIGAGASVVMDLADQFWGDRYGQIRDPFGHVWSIGAPSQEPQD